jgi:PAP2 superfamily
MLRSSAVAMLLLSVQAFAQTKPAPPNFKPSVTYELLELTLDATAREIARVGARPTVNSRELFMATAAMYDAWCLYDDTALPSHADPSLRRPLTERTDAARAAAMLAALRVVLLDLYPTQKERLEQDFAARGFKPPTLKTGPTVIGTTVGQAIVAQRQHDGANQLGDERGSSGAPYADYTAYSPVNGPTRVIDDDRWQPIPFTLDSGEVIRPGFLTPHWYRVKPFGLDRADQFRPPPPPKVGSPQLKKEVDQVLELNANLTAEEKATVEFMRDGPRSTGQSGHWLRFAQAVSRRDHHDLSRDVKLFFGVAAVCFDAFIAAWDAKRFYDSSRPWTLVRQLYRGKQVRGWLGPGKGVGRIPAEQWAPYSPASFVTPPFPGYVSGHSTVSAAAARLLAHFTGSDRFDDEETRRAGQLTEKNATHAQMQSVDGKVATADEKACDVVLPLPTFSATAELAGWSRVLGGYHIQSDNLAGLDLGRKVADADWPKLAAQFAGKLPERGP